MTGTDKSIPLTPAPGPVVILVDPQMGENIGAAARAMLNCGLTELRLVNPRDGWPNERADAMSSGALERMPPVRVFASTAEAVADLHYVYATTARPRDMVKDVFTPRSAAEDMRQRHDQGERIGILYGAERMGLINEDIAIASAVITIPLNPGFASLNLGQAVLLTTYEWLMSGDKTAGQQLVTGDTPTATQGDMDALYARLEGALEEHRFFRSPEMKPTVIRNLRAMLVRARLTQQEVNTFHGIISALTGKRLT
ncbi:MAG: RNA methyltransferase [Micavibrio aeruginosavorus]|uniref:RNA methyltransferase n=1 Tax=Micavibrio aeruginosavorus TaxID=349221 RepID=A0A7T5R4B5_9BACT|nr:MAG: RNA methyltransferase [Micavibrio aeruginosavorus]